MGHQVVSTATTYHGGGLRICEESKKRLIKLVNVFNIKKKTEVFFFKNKIRNLRVSRKSNWLTFWWRVFVIEVGRPRSRLMDPTIGWDQPEQFGPAKNLWLHIWEAEKGLDILTLRQDHYVGMGNRDYLPLDTLNNRTFGQFSDTESRTTNHQQRNVQQPNTFSNYYNPSRRKSDNRASIYSMNYNYDVLIGEYGGCPWRIPNKHYSKGVIGLVFDTFLISKFNLFISTMLRIISRALIFFPLVFVSFCRVLVDSPAREI